MKAACRLAVLAAAIMIVAGPAAAAPLSPEQHYQACLKKAEDSPDVAAAEAESWFKQGGGDRARLCLAFAQFHRGEFITAAKEFAALAAALRGSREHAASLHDQAGLAYARANDNKNAEAEYAVALKLEPQDPDIWLDRASARAGAERYWDAIDDINRALKLMPEQAEAFRLRGQVWTQLGLDSNARADFEKAEELDEEDKVLSERPAPAAKKKP